ncbi:MAG: NAD-dependent deacylase [Pelagibacteraceae bacterium]|jgi:NAD-dependent deacetylase|nr:NAD-dependent deacylase [Pelagibacteraceae bacterium]
MEHLLQLTANSEIFVLTGAGISKESGIQTFRDQDGLWNNHRVEDVATSEAFYRNPSLVYEFYNKRRKELNSGIKPNRAHIILSELEKTLNINIITQNIDNLHELAGSSSIIYMHGELNKVRCISNDSHIHHWITDLNETHKCHECGSQMRPHICWFGEMPFQMDEIHQKAEQSALFVSIGTSGEVYPAAGFVSMFKEMKKPTVELNLEPSRNQDQFDLAIHKPATVAVEEFKNLIIKNMK